MESILCDLLEVLFFLDDKFWTFFGNLFSVLILFDKLWNVFVPVFGNFLGQLILIYKF